MPRDNNQFDIPGTSDLLRAIRDTDTNLRERYKDDPLGLADRLHLLLPKKPVQLMQELGVYDPAKHGPITPGLRDLVEDVCSGEIRSALVISSRGGGKSLGVSFIEFFLVFIKDYDALNLGGSELQADQVYQYLLAYLESDKFWKSLVKGEPMRERTYTVNDAWIRVLTASQKSVRSPHAGGRKSSGRQAGGVLVIDEEAEAAPDIVNAALPTVNTARPSVVIRSSTFHNNEGTFADLVDNHQSMGFKKYNWDIFDICERCDCTGGVCESEESCFREDHIEEFVDPETGENATKLVHKAYCGGRARYAGGWIPTTEVVQLWKRLKRNHAVWEVEAMGSRPSTSGHVIRDLSAYAANIVDKPAFSLYKPGSPVYINVDWGTVAAGITVWQEQPWDHHVLLHAEELAEAGPTQIVGVILGFWNRYLADVVEVAADIGGGGNYMNLSLTEEHGIPVRNVNFAEEKEAAVAAWNIYNETNKLVIPAEFDTLHGQVRNWKRKHGRIQKGNDHLCDSAICYFSRFINIMGLSHIRITPKAFNSSVPVPTPAASNSEPYAPKRAMIRSLGSKRRSSGWR